MNPAPTTGPTPSTILWRVRALGAAFFLVFFAYSSGQQLESSLNGSQGYICLFLIYATLSCSFLCAPFVVSYCGEARLSLLLLASACFYVVFVATKLLPRAGGAATEVIQLLSCAGVGVGGGPLWGAQGYFVGRATAAYRAALEEGSTLTASSISTKLNAAFFSIWMISGGVSNAVNSLVFLTYPDPQEAVFVLFALLTLVGCLGLAALSVLPIPGEPGQGILAPPLCLRAATASPAAAGARPSEAPTAALIPAAPAPASEERGEEGGEPKCPPVARKRSWVPWEDLEQAPAPSVTASAASGEAEDSTVPSPLYMLWFIVSHREIAHLGVSSFATGASQGFVGGAWVAAAVAGTIGPSFVGFVGAAFCVSSASGAVVWGGLAQRESFGRRYSFVYAHCILLLWYACNAVAWQASGLETRSAAADGTVPPLPMEKGGLVMLLVLAMCVYSWCDPVSQAFVVATAQTYYPKMPKLACASTAPRFFYALGFSLQQFVALSLKSALGRPAFVEQCVLHTCLLLCSALSLRRLHAFAPIDGKPQPAAAR
jgi:hypothetical protein